jgi:hypothetical protein
MITAASAQPAAPEGRRPLSFTGSTFGITCGDAAVVVLVRGHVAQPLGEEPGDVHVEGGGGGEDLRVARPAQPLVALRAIRGTSRKFPFWPQAMLCWSWLTSGFEVTSSPAGVIAEWTTMPVRLSGVSVPGYPSTAT